MSMRLLLKVLGIKAILCLWAGPASAASPQTQFVRKLKPAIMKTNDSVLQERQRIEKDAEQWQLQHQLAEGEKLWLMQMANKYKLKDNRFESIDDINKLLRRVDTLPTSLVLAQAINESAWGRSRFAEQGNNYFGRWCYVSGCGLVPRQRPEGRHYEVKRYPSVAASVQDYFLNINSNPAYQTLRDIRWQLRLQHKAVTGPRLAAGLLKYSARGQAYVNDIKSIIAKYQL